VLLSSASFQNAAAFSYLIQKIPLSYFPSKHLSWGWSDQHFASRNPNNLSTEPDYMKFKTMISKENVEHTDNKNLA
jgi:hypothetical protein